MPSRKIRHYRSGMALGLLILGALLPGIFAACSKTGPATSFQLDLAPGTSCSSAPVACVQKLNVNLVSVSGAPINSWSQAFTVPGGRVSLPQLPTKGEGKFRVVGISTATGQVTVFSGTSGTVTFEPSNNQVISVPVTCPAFTTNPCATPVISGTPTATPTPVVFASGSTAALFLGQTTATACVRPNNNSGVGAGTTMTEPDGITTDSGTVLVVTDPMDERVMVWMDRTALTPDQSADFVIGHSTLTDVTINAAANDRLGGPRDVLWIGAQGLLIADTNNNRVPVFTPTPNASNGVLDYTIAQGSATAGGSGNDQNSLHGPVGLAFNTTAGLFVSDATNNRVMGYGATTTNYLTGTNQPVNAAFELGQASFGPDNPTTGATGLSGPAHLALDGNVLYVADPGNNRVLVWNNASALANDAPADFAIGQPSLTSVTAGSGNNPAASFLNAPRGVVVTNGRLVIADTGNNRVLIWQPAPAIPAAATMPITPATSVLGQTDFTGTTANAGGGATGCAKDSDETGDAGTGSNGACAATANAPTGSSLSSPGAVWLDGNNLWVSDTCNHRVLEFTAAPSP